MTSSALSRLDFRAFLLGLWDAEFKCGLVFEDDVLSRSWDSCKLVASSFLELTFMLEKRCSKCDRTCHISLLIVVVMPTGFTICCAANGTCSSPSGAAIVLQEKRTISWTRFPFYSSPIWSRKYKEEKLTSKKEKTLINLFLVEIPGPHDTKLKKVPGGKSHIVQGQSLPECLKAMRRKNGLVVWVY